MKIIVDTTRCCCAPMLMVDNATPRYHGCSDASTFCSSTSMDSENNENIKGKNKKNFASVCCWLNRRWPINMLAERCTALHDCHHGCT